MWCCISKEEVFQCYYSCNGSFTYSCNSEFLGITIPKKARVPDASVKSSVWTQVRIQDLVKGGPQVLRPKVADVAKRSCASEASNLRLGSRALKRALEAFGFLMLKYAFSHILETLFLSFLTSISTPKVDKNRTLHCTSINLKHSYILHLLFNLHEKVMLWLNDLRRYAERSEARKFYDMGGEK